MDQKNGGCDNQQAVRHDEGSESIMRLSLIYWRPAYIRLVWSVKLMCLLVATPVLAQTELFGPERDAARKAIVAPVVFDPLLTIPLTPGPEGVVDIHGSDVAGSFHIAAKNGDDS